MQQNNSNDHHMQTTTLNKLPYLEVIIRLFSYRPIYQA